MRLALADTLSLDQLGKDTVMMIQPRWHGSLITPGIWKPQSKSSRWDGNSEGRRAKHWDPVIDRSRTHAPDPAVKLSTLLQSLGFGADAATGCFGQNNAATARATAQIADWMTYLPENCVKAMVSDGWHWST
jgi:hypothetical protein